MAQLTRLYPSGVVPGILTPQTQDVDFKKYIGSTTHHSSDLSNNAIYMASVTNINSQAEISQQWQSEKTNQSYTLGQIKAPCYYINAMFKFNQQEQAQFEAVAQGVSLPDFLENLAEQAINQRRHEAILYGFDPATDLNQGILANATQSNLPSDTAGADSLTGYNPAELQQFFAGIIRDVMSSSYGMLRPVVIASSPRVINLLHTLIVSLTESQKPGAGVDSVSGLLGRVMHWLGAGNVEFIQDVTLQGETQDKIVFVAPGMDSQSESVGTEDSQNLVGFKNSIKFNTWVDDGGLRKFPKPVEFGEYATKLVRRMTPGVTLRSEAVRVVTAKYA